MSLGISAFTIPQAQPSVKWIATDLLPDTEIHSRIQQLVLYHNLSYYDANYWDLSHRTSFSLKTFNQTFLKAIKI